MKSPSLYDRGFNDISYYESSDCNFEWNEGHLFVVFLAAFLFILFFFFTFRLCRQNNCKTDMQPAPPLLLHCLRNRALHCHIVQSAEKRHPLLRLCSSLKSCLSCQAQPGSSNNDWDGLNISADTNELADPRNSEAQTTCSVSIFSRFQGILGRVRFTRRILEIPSGFPLTANTLKYRIMNNLKAIWFRG